MHANHYAAPASRVNAAHSPRVRICKPDTVPIIDLPSDSRDGGQNSAGQNAALFVVTLNDRQTIDDRYGDAEGELALCDLANLLERTFHESDLVAKLEGDEFVVLALDTSFDTAKALSGNLEGSIQAFNAAHVRPYRLSASTSFRLHDQQRPQPVAALLPGNVRASA